MTEILDKDLAEKSKKPKRKRYFHLLWILVLFLIGRTFMLMHWPGAGVMMLGSMGIMAGFFCAELISYKRNKFQLSALFVLSTGMVIYYLFTTYSVEKILMISLPAFVLAFAGFLIPVLKEIRDTEERWE